MAMYAEFMLAYAAIGIQCVQNALNGNFRQTPAIRLCAYPPESPFENDQSQSPIAAPSERGSDAPSKLSLIHI